ncbi:olfactory receptor 6N2-like [Xenopus tropicalis]|uniref:Olfactory receptor 6N2-like n=1 Tax=Xenopus tropicalis TaxID=8364 RepID=A0A8J1JW58_XENTR|nr:olfactory receptor 6N2-like [Xenopus tropicalis]
MTDISRNYKWNFRTGKKSKKVLEVPPDVETTYNSIHSNTMNVENNTNEFTFIGFSSPPLMKFWLTPALLFAYGFTIIENIFLIAVVRVDKYLQTPMYFFLGHFSFLECWYTTVIIPKTLYNLITNMTTVMFSTCILQMYLFLSLGATECLLLAAMAYDRYIAICYPLHYSIMISHHLCLLLVCLSWLGGFIAAVVPVILISKIHFCSFRINHFFCDFPPMMQLSCFRRIYIELTVSFISSTVMMSSFTVILFSYIKIIITIFFIPSNRGLHKTFSTCASHLAVVSIYYASGAFMYARPNAQKTVETNKLVALFYSVITPMLNPIIYSFRNSNVLQAMRRFLHIKKIIV